MSHHVSFPGYQKRQTNLPIDRAVLNDLRAVLGEEGSNSVADLIDLFLTDVACRLAEIRLLSKRGKWKKIQEVVSTLRGWCGSLGACDLDCDIRRMQLYLEEKETERFIGIDREEFSRLLDEAEAAYACTASELIVSAAEF